MDRNLIYLAGGGGEQQTFLFDDVYLKSLPKNGKILYLPIALRGHKLYEDAPKWLRDLINSHNRQDIEIETWTEIENKNFSDLQDFDSIFIGGGNTWSLLKEIRESDFDKLLIEFLATRGSIYGGSAGAIILGKKITSPDENEVEWKDDNGLDLLGDYSVFCHYKTDQENECQKWSEDNKLPVICLSEETGSVFDEGRFEIIGDGQGMIIKTT